MSCHELELTFLNSSKFYALSRLPHSTYPIDPAEYLVHFHLWCHTPLDSRLFTSILTHLHSPSPSSKLLASVPPSIQFYSLETFVTVVVWYLPIQNKWFQRHSEHLIAPGTSFALGAGEVLASLLCVLFKNSARQQRKKNTIYLKLIHCLLPGWNQQMNRCRDGNSKFAFVLEGQGESCAFFPRPTCRLPAPMPAKSSYVVLRCCVIFKSCLVAL